MGLHRCPQLIIVERLVGMDDTLFFFLLVPEVLVVLLEEASHLRVARGSLRHRNELLLLLLDLLLIMVSIPARSMGLVVEDFISLVLVEVLVLWELISALPSFKERASSNVIPPFFCIAKVLQGTLLVGLSLLELILLNFVFISKGIVAGEDLRVVVWMGIGKLIRSFSGVFLRLGRLLIHLFHCVCLSKVLFDLIFRVLLVPTGIKGLPFRMLLAHLLLIFLPFALFLRLLSLLPLLNAVFVMNLLLGSGLLKHLQLFIELSQRPYSFQLRLIHLVIQLRHLKRPLFLFFFVLILVGRLVSSWRSNHPVPFLLLFGFVSCALVSFPRRGKY